MTAQRKTLVEGDDFVVPASFRDAMGVKPGDTVLVELHGRELRISPDLSALERIQEFLAPYAPQGSYLSDQLIAERRAEAEREQ